MEKMTFEFTLNEEQKKLKEQKVKMLLNDENIQKWMSLHQVDSSFINDHSGQFGDWLTRISKCEHCQGLTYCRQPNEGYIMDLYIDGMLMNALRPCHFLQTKEQMDHHKAYYRIMDVPEYFTTIDLTQMNLSKESKEYKHVVAQLADYLMNEKEQKGVYFYGKPGVGKTYLAAALTNYYAKHQLTCAFVNVPKLISDLKMMFQDNDAMERRILSVKKADILVLDDIGGESMTSWSRDDILLPILEERLQSKKKTFFTSNYSMEELKERFEVTNNRMEEPIAALRLMDRIKALSSQIFVKGESRRF